MITSTQLAVRMMHEILIDVAEGTVPRTVSSFSELHDFVDANTYGGTEDILNELDSGTPDTDEGHRHALTTLIDLMNPAMDLVNDWLKSGGIRGGISI